MNSFRLTDENIQQFSDNYIMYQNMIATREFYAEENRRFDERKMKVVQKAKNVKEFSIL